MSEELESVDLSKYVPGGLAGSIETSIELYLSGLERLSTAIWYLTYIVGSAMVLLITGQVLTRYALGFVPVWGPELSRYMMIWIAITLAPVLLYNDNHLQVELLSQRLSVRRRRQLRTVQLLVLLGLFALFTRAAMIYAEGSGTIQQSPSMPFQMFWPYSMLIVGGALLVLFTVGKIVSINYYPEMIVRDYEAKFGVADGEGDG